MQQTKGNLHALHLAGVDVDVLHALLDLLGHTLRHSLRHAPQLFVQICGVAGRQTKALARAQQTNSNMNLGNNLGAIEMYTHGVFLHANHVGTVHTACSGPVEFL